MRKGWRALAIGGSAIVLIAAGWFAGTVLPKVTGPSVGESQLAPAPTATPSTLYLTASTASPTPSSPTVLAPPHFAVVSTDWRNCDHAGQQSLLAPYCVAHGIFENVGGSAGSVAVIFIIAGVAECSTVVAITPPGSVGEAGCDLGIAGLNWYNVHADVNVGPPVTVRNP